MNPATDLPALPSKLSSFTVPTFSGQNPFAYSGNDFYATGQAAINAIRAPGKAVNVINPMHYVASGTEIIHQKVKGTIGWFNVINLVFFLLSWIFWAVSWLCNIIIGAIIAAITIIISFLFNLIPFIPLFIAFFLIALICQKLWDVVLTPIIEGLIDAYNGVIDEWNVVADALRWVGFHVPIGRILGHDLGFDIGFQLLDLPYGTKANVNLGTFRKFMLDILFFAIVRPIVRSTNGYIFRDNAADITLDEFNRALGA